MNEARHVPPPSQIKKRKGLEPPPPSPVDGNSTKRTKISEPGGLISNWKQNIVIPSSIAHKHRMQPTDNEDDFVEGEFDKAEGLNMLNAVRISKPSTVRIDTKMVRALITSEQIYLHLYMQAGVKFTPHPIFRAPSGTRPKQNKAVVDDLPFPNPRTMYNSKWQKVFRPTLLSWASTFPDPYATNTVLDDKVVLNMWDKIYPDIDLDEEERRDTAVKLVYLVRIVTIIILEKVLHTFQAGNILNDWRTAIGTGALNVVRNHFLLPANRFDNERIAKFVRWGLDNKKFNFIYGAPNSEVV